MDGEPDVSRLVQTVSSYSQGAQRIPVRKKRGYGEGPSPQPPRLLQGTGDNPDLQCDLCSQASTSLIGDTPPPQPCVTAVGPAVLHVVPHPTDEGKLVPQVPPIRKPWEGRGGSDAFPMVQAGREAELGHSPAKTSTNRCQAQAGRDPGVEVTAGRPQVSRGFWRGAHPGTTALCFPVPSSPEG